MYKFKGHGRCNDSSTSPPCTGWVEMMAPVFSRVAWQCAWYMIQNDLIHAWGLDFQLGYCAQGDRTRNVGVVDSEYIVHMGLPTLGIFNGSESNNLTQAPYSHSKDIKSSGSSTKPDYHKVDNRPEVRRQSFIEMEIFKTRWQKAVKEDKCWVDPYHQRLGNQSNH
uniref:Uncharacterized protein n=1 Tax=Rhizophora mucronata TaxID=61149 RepID=A0A2P2M222_RHIMU